jgi:hypothetical protein
MKHETPDERVSQYFSITTMRTPATQTAEVYRSLERRLGLLVSEQTVRTGFTVSNVGRHEGRKSTRWVGLGGIGGLGGMLRYQIYEPCEEKGQYHAKYDEDCLRK